MTSLVKGELVENKKENSDKQIIKNNFELCAKSYRGLLG